MLKSKTRWIVKETDKTAVNHLVEALNITPLVSTLLVNRGILEVEEAQSFLFSNEESFHDPYLLFDMEKAISRIEQAIKKDEQILVYGDYDADGVSSTTVLMTVLKDLGANVEFYIPNRFTEGYGPNPDAFRWAADQGFSLIITVDTGIAAVNEADIAKELGMDLIITDHHEPGPELPDCYAIIHPKHPESQYPFRELAGVGVAFKVAHALYKELPVDMLDIVAIGTIADLVPLQGENRSIVKKGLKQLAITSRPGLKALFEISNTNQSEITEETVGFTIGPRLNAAGRLDSADPAVELLLSNNYEIALSIAKEIDTINKERQSIVNEITKEAIMVVESDPMHMDSSVLVIGNEGWNAGVIGIVASRLVDKFYRPTIVLSFDSEKKQAKGSARSIVGFDLFQNLSTCRDILPHFGGHPMAAGMTLNLDDVDDLRSRLNTLANEILTKEDFIPITEIDACISLEDIHLNSIQQLEMLSPYGVANPKPKIQLEALTLQQIRQIGADNKHLKVVLEHSDMTLDGVGFGLGEYASQISPVAEVSVIGELAINEWNNIRKPQIFLKDMRIDSWQLFDVRGNKQWKKWIPSIPAGQSYFIAFHQDTVSNLPLKQFNIDCKIINEENEAESLDIDSRNIVLLDMPPTISILDKLLMGKNPSRIYTHFHQNQNHFFSTIPTREHFKWFYAFIHKRKTFDLNRYGDELASYRGWSRDTIDFMSQVFFELEFVTIIDGIISLNSNTIKRDLTESKSYQQKLLIAELENDLLYSSYRELKLWFDKRMTCSVKHEEETRQWT